MQDFIRQVRVETDALLDFRNNLSGNTSNNRVSSSNSNNASNKTDDLLTSDPAEVESVRLMIF